MFGVDLETATNPSDWNVTHRVFMRRHLLADKTGVVDQPYLEKLARRLRSLAAGLCSPGMKSSVLWMLSAESVDLLSRCCRCHNCDLAGSKFKSALGKRSFG
jgi:hypothetical protein